MNVNFGQPQKSKIELDDIHTLAPTIIDEVAFMLMSDRPHTETDLEIRFGNRGSFSVNKRQGTFYDFEQAVGGGLLDMIMHLCDYEHKSQAVDWLQEKGFIDGTFTPAPRTLRPKISRQQATGDMFKVGLELWQEAKPIPFYQYHPVRRWCLHRNLLPGYKEIPAIIRWHEKKHFIIVALAPIKDFINAYPAPPAPRQFHLISIDRDGNKRFAFRENTDDKSTWGIPGVTCMAIIGDPNHNEINICEGLADGLAISTRCPGAVLIAFTTFHKLANCTNTLAHLTAPSRATTIFADNDDAGVKAQERLASTIYHQGGDVFYHLNPTAKDPADAAAKEVQA